MAITSTVTEQTFNEVQAANPGVDIEILVHDKLPIEVIARSPKGPEYAIYRNFADEGKRRESIESLVSFCVIWPAKEERQAIIDAHPAIAGVWAGEIVEMAGFTAGARRKKF